MLQGKIDKYPVTMHLHKAGPSYTGYYYYDNQQQPIYFSGDDTTEKGTVRLYAYSSDVNNEQFSFTVADKTASGTWRKSDSSRQLTFTASEASLPLSFQYIYSEGETKLLPKAKESPVATYEGSAVWPVEKNATADFVRREIRKSFAEKDPGGEIGGLLLKNKKKFFEDYRADNGDLKEADLEEGGISYNYDLSERLQIAFQSPKLVCLAFTTYSFTGGAHGNYGTTYTSLDLTRNKALEVKDVLNAQGLKALQRLLERNFRRQFNLKDTDPLSEGGLFEDHIKPNNNFYVTSKGIGFSYVPYEIGPYAMGEVNIYIPLKDVQAYLLPAFKSLIQ
jgi:hypothetical protein